MRIILLGICFWCLGGQAQSGPPVVESLESYLNTLADPYSLAVERNTAFTQARRILLKDSLSIFVHYDLADKQVVRVFENLEFTRTLAGEARRMLVEVDWAEVCITRKSKVQEEGVYLVGVDCLTYKNGRRQQNPMSRKTGTIAGYEVPEYLVANFGITLKEITSPKPEKAPRELPVLDWPPPLATAQGSIPEKWFGSLRVNQMLDRIEEVMNAYGYLQLFRYRIEDQRAIAIVSAPERIHSDGSAYIERRFSAFTPSEQFSLGRVAESLQFFGVPGTYRLWLLAVQESRPGQYSVTPYVYLFELPEPTTAQPDPEARLILSDLRPFEQHLEKSGWVKLLRGY